MQMFECPQCGASSALAGDRETPACSLCGANARFCGIILAVLQVAFGGSRLPLIQQEPRKDIVAIGVSDSSCYSDLMSQRLQYRNTFFHAEPLLDICDPASCAGYAPADLIVCSDVIEHTADPPHVVLANLHSMLSPGGSRRQPNCALWRGLPGMPSSGPIDGVHVTSMIIRTFTAVRVRHWSAGCCRTTN
jgi:hypothetical protein